MHSPLKDLQSHHDLMLRKPLSQSFDFWHFIIVLMSYFILHTITVLLNKQCSAGNVRHRLIYYRSAVAFYYSVKPTHLNSLDQPANWTWITPWTSEQVFLLEKFLIPIYGIKQLNFFNITQNNESIIKIIKNNNWIIFYQSTNESNNHYSSTWNESTDDMKAPFCYLRLYILTWATGFGFLAPL